MVQITPNELEMLTLECTRILRIKEKLAYMKV